MHFSYPEIVLKFKLEIYLRTIASIHIFHLKTDVIHRSYYSTFITHFRLNIEKCAAINK